MADQYVYVRDEEYSWVPALVIEQTKDTATVAVANYKNEAEITGENNHGARKSKVTVKLKDYPNRSLPLQNVVEGRVKEVADMIDLSFLHEAAILYNLKARHVKSHPYTRTGDILIAVNPYRWFHSLYTEENRTHYSRALVWQAAQKDYDPRKDLLPHVYESSALAYLGLSSSGTNQSILVSGESGAGKTETVKICMNHLASVVQQENQQDGGAAQDQQVITRVLDSNPLLEAFGNAKTLRNDNSSRFGKYTQLQFEPGSRNHTHLTLKGSFTTVYLLEKSRVVRHEYPERTFHIFYQLLAASDSTKAQFWSKLKGTSYSSFSYVGESDTTQIEGVSDADQFQRTIHSLEMIGVEGQTLKTFMRAICVVLQLGNLTFGPSPKDSDHSIITSGQALKDLADLMGIQRKQLQMTLTERIVKVRSETTSVPLNQEGAKDSADALAKQIYDRLFLWLVKSINRATTAGNDEEKFGTIGLLDIFGFESFPVNGFEQLCINYANEQLQQKFTKDVFVAVFEEYESEGISLDQIQYDDNTHVLDLIQNRTGLLAMLNEECIRPNGSDSGFVNKALHANKGSPSLIVPRIRSNAQFGIHHYAGDVIYDATDFVSKNQDTLPSDLLECACNSSNEIIANELSTRTSPSRTGGRKNAAPARKKSNIVAPTVWTKYKDQLARLMTALHKTQSRYIRCVKPNSVKKPKLMEHELTLQQLRSAGVISAVTLARSAFPNRLEHVLLLSRFYQLWPGSIPRSKSSDSGIRKQSEVLLNHALKTLERDGVKPFVIGKTRAYFRAGALEFLEASRLKGMEAQATRIQSAVRMYLAKKKADSIKRRAILERYQLLNDQAVSIQSAWRCAASRRRLRELRKEARNRAKKAKKEKRRNAAAIKIQCAVRVRMAQKQREKRYVQYIKDQAKVLKKQKKLKKLDKAATMIQKYARRLFIRRKYGAILERTRERTRLKEKIQKIKKKAAKADKTRKKELEMAKNGIDIDRAGREAWEESVLTASEETAQTETAKMIEYLQGEHRKLQIKSKTLDGMIKPLKKNFETLMEENKELREEFKEIQQKNEAVKAANKELVDRRNAAEKKTKEFQDELKLVSDRFMPVAHGRRDFQNALKEILDTLKMRCKDEQLIEDVTLLAYQCEADAKTLQAGADAANELGLSPKKGGRRSDNPKTPPSSRKSTSKTRRKARSGIDSVASPGLAETSPFNKGSRRRKLMFGGSELAADKNSGI